jgi:hypothetical protein
MNITYLTTKTVEEIFGRFEYPIDFSTISSATCIAYQNFGGEDRRSVFEIYINKQPRFFSVSILEYSEDSATELAYIKKWTEATNVELLDKQIGENHEFYLFELNSPFGIHFGKF